MNDASRRISATSNFLARTGGPGHSCRYLASGGRLSGCLILLTAMVGCRGGSGAMAPPSVSLSEPTRLCNEPLIEDCRPAEQIEAWMRSPHLGIVDATRTAGGNQGAYVLTLKEESDPDAPIYFRTKWRAAASSGWANEPRHELVAYGVQKLLLKPEQYVIPPTTGYCFPLEEYEERVDATARASWEGLSCVYGYMSLWLSDAENLAASASDEAEIGPELYSEQRFFEDPVYARKLARLNALAVLIHHNDAHPGQFLVASDPFRVFSVDHSLALTSIKNPLVFFNEDWSTWRLPAIPEDLAETIQSLGADDVERLAVLETYDRAEERLIPRLALEKDNHQPPRDNAARHVLEKRPEGDDEGGVYFEGGTLHVGTTPRERSVVLNQLDVLQRTVASVGVERYRGASPSGSR